MYEGDGWVGDLKPVKACHDMYTNTVETERLRDVLKKERVRSPHVLTLSLQPLVLLLLSRQHCHHAGEAREQRRQHPLHRLNS